jgi:dethiobiotin synthetase
MHGAQAYFVTGTDTEVGKTYTTCALLATARSHGLIAIGMKPVAAGLDDASRNEDVEQLAAASSFRPAAGQLNPYAFKAAIAPHLAAADEGRTIDFGIIDTAVAELRQQADLLLVEGVGGFRVPLGPTQDSADLAVRLDLPVILVVGLRLGCINHALLTAEAITARGLPLAGWVGNAVVPDMVRRDDNIDALRQRLEAPLLGVLLHRPNPAENGPLFLP